MAKPTPTILYIIFDSLFKYLIKGVSNNNLWFFISYSKNVLFCPLAIDLYSNKTFVFK